MDIIQYHKLKIIFYFPSMLETTSSYLLLVRFYKITRYFYFFLLFAFINSFRKGSARQFFTELIQWPNLKNLSGGLNLSRGLNVSRFKPALNLNRVLADLNRGSNSLNSISEKIVNPFLYTRCHSLMNWLNRVDVVQPLRFS